MIDSEIFGQNQALEKPPRGKPVRERERDFIIFSKISEQKYSENLTYLHPRFHLKILKNVPSKALQTVQKNNSSPYNCTASISVPCFILKAVQSLPRFLCQK